MAPERELLNRVVGMLPVGTRVRCSRGVGKLDRVDFMHARITLDAGGHHDMAPGGEVDVLEEQTGLITDALGNAAPDAPEASEHPVTSRPDPIPSAAICDTAQAAVDALSGDGTDGDENGAGSALGPVKSCDMALPRPEAPRAPTDVPEPGSVTSTPGRRRPTRTAMCEGCGEPFEATRADARFHPRASCRKRAERERERRKTGAAPG